MVMQSGDFVRYTFVTDKCEGDLSDMLNCMIQNQLLPATVETTTKERGAIKVILDVQGATDAHMHVIGAGIDRRPSIRYFGYERLSQEIVRADMANAA